MSKKLIIIGIFYLLFNSCQPLKHDKPKNGKDYIDNRAQDSIKKITTTYDTLYGFVSDTIKVEMPVSFTSGRLWQVTFPDSVMSLLLTKDIQKSEQNTLSEYQVFYFGLTKIGAHPVMFRYARPFGIDTSNIKILNKIFIVNSKNSK